MPIGVEGSRPLYRTLNAIVIEERGEQRASRPQPNTPEETAPDPYTSPLKPMNA